MTKHFISVTVGFLKSWRTVSTSKQQKGSIDWNESDKNCVYKCVYVRVCVCRGAGRRSVAQSSGRKHHNSQQVHSKLLPVAFCNDKTKASRWVLQIDVRLPSSAPVICRLQVREVIVFWVTSSNHKRDLGHWASAEHCFLSSFSCPGWTCTCSGHWTGWWCQWDRGQQLESGLQHAVCGSQR